MDRDTFPSCTAEGSVTLEQSFFQNSRFYKKPEQLNDALGFIPEASPPPSTVPGLNKGPVVILSIGNLGPGHEAPCVPCFGSAGISCCAKPGALGFEK